MLKCKESTCSREADGSGIITYSNDVTIGLKSPVLAVYTKLPKDTAKTQNMK